MARSRPCCAGRATSPPSAERCAQRREGGRIGIAEGAMATTTFDMNDLKRRMQGAIASLKQELAGLRTGRASTGTARTRPGRGLWQPYAAQSARHGQRAGAAAAQRPGLGSVDDPRGREGDFGRQSRIDALDRRAGHQAAHSRAQRGAAAGNRQGRAQIRRSRARGGTPRPPRRPRPSQEAREGSQDQRGRPQSRKPARCRRRPTRPSPKSTSCSPARKRRS